VTASRPTSRRLALLVLGAGATLSIAALAAGAGYVAPAATAIVGPASAVMPDTLSFDVEYAGVGAEGIGLIWRGHAEAVVPAQVTIRVEYAGGSDDHAMLRMNIPIEQRIQLHRPGLAGAVTVVFLPRVALSDGLAAGF
jgi:hypothetical protein